MSVCLLIEGDDCVRVTSLRVYIHLSVMYKRGEAKYQSGGEYHCQPVLKNISILASLYEVLSFFLFFPSL